MGKESKRSADTPRWDDKRWWGPQFWTMGKKANRKGNEEKKKQEREKR